MKIQLIDDFAHQFFRARGDYAEYEAAQKARTAACPTEAAQWRKIRELVRQLRMRHAT